MCCLTYEIDCVDTDMTKQKIPLFNTLHSFLDVCPFIIILLFSLFLNVCLGCGIITVIENIFRFYKGIVLYRGNDQIETVKAILSTMANIKIVH